MIDLLMDMLSDKADVIKFLLKTAENNDKYTKGLRMLKDKPVEVQTSKLLDVVANQAAQNKKLCLLLLIYSQSSSFDSDVAKMLNKMGRGEEALKQMFKNKFK